MASRMAGFGVGVGVATGTWPKAAWLTPKTNTEINNSLNGARGRRVSITTKAPSIINDRSQTLPTVNKQVSSDQVFTTLFGWSQFQKDPRRTCWIHKKIDTAIQAFVTINCAIDVGLTLKAAPHNLGLLFPASPIHICRNTVERSVLQYWDAVTDSGR